MSSIAVITARGGSKRIPRKNIKEFCGKPIIAYSIEAALLVERRRQSHLGASGECAYAESGSAENRS